MVNSRRLFAQLRRNGFRVARQDLSAVATPHQDLLAADGTRFQAAQAPRGVDDGRVGGALVQDSRRVGRRLRAGGVAEREGQESSHGRGRPAVQLARRRRRFWGAPGLLALRPHVERAVGPRDAHGEAHGRRGRRRPVERGLLCRKDCGGLARALRALRRRRHHGRGRLAEPLAARGGEGFVGGLGRDVLQPFRCRGTAGGASVAPAATAPPSSCRLGTAALRIALALKEARTPQVAAAWFIRHSCSARCRCA